MRKLFTILIMLFCFTAIGQNRSDGSVANFNFALPQQQFTNPLITPFAPEIFRFQPGLITQLDDVQNVQDPFGFNDNRWFSIGRLETSPDQTVYGLRFQLPNRALTYGYQDIGDSNPRIQWIDDSSEPGNLEFRFADSFMSTNSIEVARMTSDGQFILPNLSGIIPSPFPTGGIRFRMENYAFDQGIYARTALRSNSLGIAIWGQSGNNNSNVGVRGTVGNLPSGANFAYAIEGIAAPNGDEFTNTSFAGFFNGNVEITGTLDVTSDRKLKRDINESQDVLKKLAQLKSYTYEFKDNPDLNLSLGLQHGLIAQDVEKVYPELVKVITYPIYNDKHELQDTGTYKSVNYLGLISELTAAVNELNQKVKDLKASKTTLVYSSQFTQEELAKIRANGFQLEQNIPNPFSGATSIEYSLPESNPQASIMIFDLSGKLIQTYQLKERSGQLRVNQSDLGESGMYLYSLFAGGKEIMTKRMLVK